jgi:opacity protein-like surface antigen
MTGFPGLTARKARLTPNEGIVVMVTLRPLVLAGVAAASCGWANAADLLPPAPSLPPLSPTEADFTGWYLRGDVGLGVNATRPELQTSPDQIVAGLAGGLLSSAASQAFNNTTLSPFGMVDFGLGYQFNSWFRIDGTLEYRGGARLQSLYTLTDLASPDFGGPAQFSDFCRGDVSSFIGLINGYANIGTWYGISPFVGAGVGFADNNVSGFTDHGLGYANFGSLGSGGAYFANGSRTAFAWALMAGLDFIVTPNLKLEFSYRYLNHGSIKTGSSNCLAGASGGTFSNFQCITGMTSSISSRNTLASNDFRLGLIYLLGETPAPAAGY